MFIRFTLLSQDPDSRRKTGILVAAHEVSDEASLPLADHRRLRELLDWFDLHLPSPEPLEKDENVRALSWFKPGATEAVQKMWALKSLLDGHGIHVEVHKTVDPGGIIYEDAQQVVARPRKGQKIS